MTLQKAYSWLYGPMWAEKFNENHGPDGKFASSDGGGGDKQLQKVSEQKGRAKFDTALDIADKIKQDASRETKNLDKNDPMYESKVFNAYVNAVEKHFGNDTKEMKEFAQKLAPGFKSVKESPGGTHQRIAEIIRRAY